MCVYTSIGYIFSSCFCSVYSQLHFTAREYLPSWVRWKISTDEMKVYEYTDTCHQYSWLICFHQYSLLSFFLCFFLFLFSATIYGFVIHNSCKWLVDTCDQSTVKQSARVKLMQRMFISLFLFLCLWHRVYLHLTWRMFYFSTFLSQLVSLFIRSQRTESMNQRRRRTFSTGYRRDERQNISLAVIQWSLRMKEKQYFYIRLH